jgi:hypothetical protein
MGGAAMNNTNHLDPREQLDLLVSRIVDGESGEADWAAFNAMAEQRPEAWKTLAQAQREHGAMSLAVGVALHATDRVELPSVEAADLFTARRHAPARVRTWTRLGAFSGWAAAAAVLVMAWNGAFNFGSVRVPTSIAENPGSTASLGGAVVPAGWTLNTPDDAVRAYLDLGARSGNVIGELPGRVPLRTEPVVLSDGQRAVKVIYLRQFAEQAIVTDLARLATDEAGRPIAVPATPFVPMAGPQ